MAFKKRKVDRRKLDAPVFSGAAEVCETRALLSADGICLPAVDADAVVLEDVEVTDSEEVVDVEATVEEGEFIPELAICTMLPVFEGEVIEDLGGDDVNDVVITDDVVDPNLMFYSFMSVGDSDVDVVDGEVVATCDLVADDGSVIDEQPVFKGEVVEDVVVDGEEPAEVTFDDFDPSWLYRSFAGNDEEVVDDENVTGDVVDGEVPQDLTDGGIKVQVWHDLIPVDNDGVVVDETDGTVDVTTLEDYDPSWAYRGGIADDGEPTDDGSEDPVVEDEEIAVDGEIVEKEFDNAGDDATGEEGEVPIRYYFGMNYRGPVGGDIPVEVLAMSSGVPAPNSSPSVMGPIAISSPVVAPPADIPVVINQPFVIPTASPSLSILVQHSTFTTLFATEEEPLVTALAPVVSEIEPLASEVEDAISSGLDFGFGELIPSAADNSDAAVGELTPIFEDEQDAEEPAQVPAAEESPVETEESLGAVEFQQPVVIAARASHGRSIDEFMSEFAMSGFTG